MNTKFQLLIKTKIPTNKEFYCFKSLRCCIYRANNVKMPTIVGILTFMSRKKFVLSWVDHGNILLLRGLVKFALDLKEVT